MKNVLLTVLFASQVMISQSQTCADVTTIVSEDYSYSNEKENFSLPFNESWSILIENQEAIVAVLTDGDSQNGAESKGTVSILKNPNGNPINSVYEISESLISQLFKGAGLDVSNVKSSNTFVKNLKVKMVEYDYKVYNLNETYFMSGIMFMLLKDDATFVFMFNCPKTKKSCYIPFYKDVMSKSFFNQNWY